MAKREAEIKLDETDFYEKKMIYKKKKLILEEEVNGMQLPDVVDIRKEERKERRKMNREKKRKKKQEQINESLLFL